MRSRHRLHRRHHRRQRRLSGYCRNHDTLPGGDCRRQQRRRHCRGPRPAGRRHARAHGGVRRRTHRGGGRASPAAPSPWCATLPTPAAVRHSLAGRVTASLARWMGSSTWWVAGAAGRHHRANRCRLGFPAHLGADHPAQHHAARSTRILPPPPWAAGHRLLHLRHGPHGRQRQLRRHQGRGRDLGAGRGPGCCAQAAQAASRRSPAPPSSLWSRRWWTTPCGPAPPNAPSPASPTWPAGRSRGGAVFDSRRSTAPALFCAASHQLTLQHRRHL